MNNTKGVENTSVFLLTVDNKVSYNTDNLTRQFKYMYKYTTPTYYNFPSTTQMIQSYYWTSRGYSNYFCIFTSNKYEFSEVDILANSETTVLQFDLNAKWYMVTRYIGNITVCCDSSTSSDSITISMTITNVEGGTSTQSKHYNLYQSYNLLQFMFYKIGSTFIRHVTFKITSTCDCHLLTPQHGKNYLYFCSC